MAFDSLIPFALNPETDQLVDVGSVPRGKACGCICPSCKTPLTARQGETKEWHFAHRSRNVHKKTEDKCEYSFAVSVRMMIRQLSEDGVRFKTPDFKGLVSASNIYSHQVQDFPYTVTFSRLIQLDHVDVGVSIFDAIADVVCSIGSFKLIIYITYKDRKIPNQFYKLDSVDCGVLEISANQIFDLYAQEREGRYTEVLRRFLEENTYGKKWIYHPRENLTKAEALKHRDTWIDKQNSNIAVYSAVEESVGFLTNLKKHLCIKCNYRWKSASAFCERCGSDKYSKVI